VPFQSAIRRKNHLWRDLAHRRHYGFVAAAAETTGRLSEPLAGLINSLLGRILGDAGS
jgi:hypothetical protein